MTQPTNQGNSFTGHLSKATLCTGLSALTAGLFTSIHPVGGAIFGLSGYCTKSLIDNIYRQFDFHPNHIFIRVASIFICIASASAITTACGFPITIKAGFFFSGGILGTAMGTTAVIGSCFLIAMLVSGAYFSRNRGNL